jgi:hypothetical protein
MRERCIYSARLPGSDVDAHEASYGDLAEDAGRAVLPRDVFPR